MFQLYLLLRLKNFGRIVIGLGDILKIKATHGLISAVIAMISGWFVL